MLIAIYAISNVQIQKFIYIFLINQVRLNHGIILLSGLLIYDIFWVLFYL